MDGNDSQGKEIPESIFADDDGSADATLAQALIRHSRGKAPVAEVVDALAYARVLVPVMASGEQRHIGKHGLEQDEVASTGVVAVQMPDGRSALPVFTDVDAMRAWNPAARPIPAEGPRAALAAVAEDWSVLVINPGMESVVIPRPAVWALGAGEVWHPAVVDGAVDAHVRAAVVEAITTDAVVLEADAVPGVASEVAVMLRLAPGLTRPELEDVLARVQHELAASDVIAQRVDSLELKLAQG
jgi:hypothetical protein